jgi:radical SAM protein with 4Fe4S-binding SPASM domain
MNANYFRFYPDCHYVKGPSRGAIYCLTENKLLHLSPEESAITNQWLDNETVETVERANGETSRNLLKRLVKNGLGTTFSAPVYCEPYEPSKAYQKEELLDLPPQIKMAYVQASSKCNAGCSFCGDPDYLISNGCNSCLRWKETKGTTLQEKDRKALLDQIQDLEAKGLTFSGGNPLQDWDNAIEAVNMAVNRRPSIRVVVQTNGSGFTDQVEQDARGLNIEFIFSVFASSREDYERITGSADLYEDLLNAVKRCQASGLKYSFCIVICPESWADYSEIQQFTDKLGGNGINICEVISRHDKTTPMASLPNEPEECERYFEHLDSEGYFAARHYNRCLDGRVALSAKGAILPCPHWESPFGQFPPVDVAGCFRKQKPQKLWKKTKDDVPTCSSCELRYACADCSVTEQYRKKDPTIHSVFCTYRPETGTWIDKPVEIPAGEIQTSAVVISVGGS